MKQAPLFDDAAAASGTLPATLAIAGSQPALGKEQKQFNKLIAQIEALQQSAQQWRDYGQVYQRRYQDEIAPLHQQMREARIAMVGLLDQAVGSRELGKRQRDKVRDILLGQLSELLGQSEDAELLRLYDKHSDFPYADGGDEDFDEVRAMAREVFGIDLPDPGQAAPGADDPADPFGEPAPEFEQAASRPPPRKARKKSAKAQAREAAREQAEQGGSRSIREIYRKLVSELHPDREPDAEQRARKTELMQQVNRAYEARDLLALLQLQLRLEQIAPGTLAGLAEERLRHYNFVLQQQLQRLKEEVQQLMEPFLTMMRRGMRELSPHEVQRAIDADIGDMQASLKSIRDDLVNFRDIRNLKASLRDYRIGQSDEDELDIMLELLAAQQQRRRRRR